MTASPTVLIISMLIATAAVAQTTQPSVAQKLDLRVELNLEGLTLPQAFEKIAEQTRLNIVPAWSSLEGIGVDATAKLRGQVKDVTARQAIELALRAAGATRLPELVPDGPLLEIDPGLVAITRVYPIGKIVDARNKQRGPTTMPAAEQFRDAADDLVKTVVKTIDPATWRDAGGTIGAVSLLGKQMIVTQTRENHRKIEALLRELEKTGAQ